MIEGVPSNKPHVPPPISPKDVGKDIRAEQKPAAKAAAAKASNIGRGPELDARAISVRLAAAASEAKKKEISGDAFEKILQEVINMTGLKDAQGAMEEANRKLQQDIETELAKIKGNKDLMDEAESWQSFAELLAQMNEDQAESMLGMLKQSIREL